MVKLKDKANLEVAEHRKSLIVKALRRDAINRNTTIIGLHQRAYNLQKCRLTGATCTHQRHNLATLDLQRYTVQHLQVVETLLDTLNLNHSAADL